jgi:hypothetical protein
MVPKNSRSGNIFVATPVWTGEARRESLKNGEQNKGKLEP